MTASFTVLITGATAGIGRHAALHLARQGHHVIASGRRTDALDALRAEAQGLRLDVVSLDVTDASSIAAAVREVDRLTDGRGVDALVNNAGYGLVGPLELLSDADLRAQYDTNVFGLLAVTRAFVPRMRARGAGRIVNVSSMGGHVTFPLMGAYNSTKYAVESLSDALRMELAPFGIRVVLIEPGAIHSDFANRAMGSAAKYRAVDSPYAPVLARAEEMEKWFDRTAVGPRATSRAIEKAITRRRPAARYVTPLSALLGVWLMRLLPTRWLDAILGRVTGLTRELLAATPALALVSETHADR